MKKLILMRHAKSSWDNPALDDHARPWNGRGRVSADAMGDWLRNRKYTPDQALVSDSARTRETFLRLGFICDTSFESALYHASAQGMQKQSVTNGPEDPLRKNARGAKEERKLP